MSTAAAVLRGASEPSTGQRGGVSLAVDPRPLIPISRAIGVLAVALGLSVLLGWYLKVSSLESVFPGLATMKPNTAMGFVLAGLSLSLSLPLSTRGRWSPLARAVAKTAAVAVVLLSGLTLAEYLVRADFGIDQIFFRDLSAGARYPGRTAPHAAVSLFLLGGALSLLDVETRDGHSPAQLLALVAGLIGLVASIGHLYSAVSLYRIATHASMAVHTSIGVLAVSAGVLIARPERGINRVLLAEGPAGVMARRLIPVVLVVPVVLGWLRLEGQRAGLFGTEVGVALLVTSSILVFSGFLYGTARSIERADAGRRQAEESSSEQAAILQSVFDSMADGVIVADENGRFLLTNRFAQRLTASAPGDVDPRLWPGSYGVFRSDRETPFAWAELPLVRAVRGESSDESEMFVRNPAVPDGVFVSVSGRPLTDSTGASRGGVVVVHDISERKRAEEEIRELNRELEQRVIDRTAQLEAATNRLHAEGALRASEERYRGLMEHAQDAIFVVDKRGIVVEANAAAERLLKTSRSAIEGRSFIETVAEEHREDVQRRFERTLERGSTQGEETRALRSDGTAVPIEISASVVEVGGEKLVLAIIRDISEQNAMAEQFRLSQKMEAIGQLAGGVAHDFNNLLTAILGYSHILAADLRGNPEHFSAIEEIRKAGERAAGLTRQLLAFSRKQILELRILDLNEVVRHFEEMLSRLIGEDIEIVTRLDPRLASVRADAGQMEQVIMNLVVNARDAMPKGGRISIETANVELDEGYVQTHVHAQPGPYVLLAVSDTGLGMDEATRSRIFEPFFTTKEKGRGTGLGLSTVYGIVKQSGGYIWVYSEPAKGTTFKVYLPRVATAAEPLPVSRDQEIEKGGAETILLVEDEDSVRALAGRILESKGYTVLAAASGAEAIDVARQHPEIDLLLTDMVLAGMGGSEIASRIRELYPKIKVLYSSGYTDDVMVRRGFSEKGAAFLEKPFTPNVLARKVRAVLDS